MDSIFEFVEDVFSVSVYVLSVFCIMSIFMVSQKNSSVMNGVFNGDAAGEYVAYEYSYTEETVKGSSIADIIISETDASLYINGVLLDENMTGGLESGDIECIKNLYSMVNADERYCIYREYDADGNIVKISIK